MASTSNEELKRAALAAAFFLCLLLLPSGVGSHRADLETTLPDAGDILAVKTRSPVVPKDVDLSVFSRKLLFGWVAPSGPSPPIQNTP
ncbi:hypothetical protein KP509_20G024300 [Ceratopteris richardii]|uniref:Uncharacterized protein n=1 Tax=Ceratopteris richardii TaxID=49495 RepID=A0A8T2SFK0_CERRI|nr:hypothetical protein KP509_20G024300 [Ceratopteris richardii]